MAAIGLQRRLALTDAGGGATNSNANGGGPLGLYGGSRFMDLSAASFRLWEEDGQFFILVPPLCDKLQRLVMIYLFSIHTSLVLIYLVNLIKPID